MSEKEKLYVVTRNGQKVTQPATLAEANAQASEMRSLLESQGQTATIAVVPVLLG